MYTILLVEDEEAVRQSIRDLTPWEEYGFSVMGEASNGMEALEIISETMPDVIITDIRMPYMDGIQFIKEVRDKYSQSVLVIFLSGYDEFTFAQTALSLNAAEYVLKPVSVDSMRALLGRIREKLDEDVARVSDRTKLEAFYHDAFDIYKEKFLVSLITPTEQRGKIGRHRTLRRGDISRSFLQRSRIRVEPALPRVRNELITGKNIRIVILPQHRQARVQHVLHQVPLAEPAVQRIQQVVKGFV